MHCAAITRISKHAARPRLVVWTIALRILRPSSMGMRAIADRRFGGGASAFLAQSLAKIAQRALPPPSVILTAVSAFERRAPAHLLRGLRPGEFATSAITRSYAERALLRATVLCRLFCRALFVRFGLQVVKGTWRGGSLKIFLYGPAPGPVTSFLFLRYRLQSFKIGAQVLRPRVSARSIWLVFACT
jgi:hypothetical protein